MKILITGAHGQLGRELKDASAFYPNFVIDYTDAHTLDITSYDALVKTFANGQYDWCINCAAYTAVDKAESDVEMAQKINAEAPGLVAAAAAKYGAKLIHISTDFVFDGRMPSPYQEDDATEPLSAYGRTKLDGENRCMAANPASTIIRTAWLYSNYGNNFVNTMRRLGKERETLNVIYDQVGTPTYARDLAYAIWKIVETNDASLSGLYHYSNEGVASWYDFAHEIMELSKLTCKVKPINTYEYPTPATRPAYCLMSKKKIKAAFHIEIPHWRESLKHCIALLDEHGAHV